MTTTTITSAPDVPPTLGLQAHFYRPPEPPPHQLDTPSPPSLEGEGITHEVPLSSYCPYGRWILAVCTLHGNRRWIYAPCKKRNCRVCGVKRRHRVAWRIAHGLETLTGDDGGGWFMGTWAYNVDKATAVKAVTRFVAWLRRTHVPEMQYACTWELTQKGRLHVNLVMAPWNYLHHSAIGEAWQRLGAGKVVWIKRVGAGIGQEAAKSREKCGNYFSKWEQMVPTRKAATYSKDWPKLPETPFPERIGEIKYYHERFLPSGENPPAVFPDDYAIRLWHQPRLFEFCDPEEPWCNCFNLRPEATGPPSRASPDAAVDVVAL